MSNDVRQKKTGRYPPGNPHSYGKGAKATQISGNFATGQMEFSRTRNQLISRPIKTWRSPRPLTDPRHGANPVIFGIGAKIAPYGRPISTAALYKKESDRNGKAAR